MAGVSHRSNDGTSRQKIIAACEPLERLLLHHDEHNPHDPNAVRVCRQDGEQIGFLKAELAEEVVYRSARGYRYGAFVKNITGGTEDAPTLGVNLLILVAEPGVSDQEAQNCVDMLDLSDTDVARQSGSADSHPRRKPGCMGMLVLCLLVVASLCLLAWAV